MITLLIGALRQTQSSQDGLPRGLQSLPHPGPYQPRTPFAYVPSRHNIDWPLWDNTADRRAMFAWFHNGMPQVDDRTKMMIWASTMTLDFRVLAKYQTCSTMKSLSNAMEPLLEMLLLNNQSTRYDVPPSFENFQLVPFTVLGQDQCLMRDNYRCVVTGRPNPTLYSILPTLPDQYHAEVIKCALQDAQWAFSYRTLKALQGLIRGDVLNSASNLIALDSRIGWYWSTAQIGFQPVVRLSQGKSVFVAIRFLPQWNGYSAPWNPDGTAKALRDVLTPHRPPPDLLFRNPDGTPVRDGDVLEFREISYFDSKRNAIVTVPAPDMDLLELQWSLVRMAAMSGAADGRLPLRTLVEDAPLEASLADDRDLVKPWVRPLHSISMERKRSKRLSRDVAHWMGKADGDNQSALGYADDEEDESDYIVDYSKTEHNDDDEYDEDDSECDDPGFGEAVLYDASYNAVDNEEAEYDEDDSECDDPGFGEAVLYDASYTAVDNEEVEYDEDDSECDDPGFGEAVLYDASYTAVDNEEVEYDEDDDEHDEDDSEYDDPGFGEAVLYDASYNVVDNEEAEYDEDGYEHDEDDSEYDDPGFGEAVLCDASYTAVNNEDDDEYDEDDSECDDPGFGEAVLYDASYKAVNIQEDEYYEEAEYSQEAEYDEDDSETFREEEKSDGPKPSWHQGRPRTLSGLLAMFQAHAQIRDSNERR